MQQLQKVSILLYSYPNEDFWKRNSFLKLCLNAFEKKKRASFRWVKFYSAVFKDGKNRKVMSFVFKTEICVKVIKIKRK